MENKGFDEVMSENSKEALQSETWTKVRTAMNTEIQHFTDSSEIQSFHEVKQGKFDDAYGVARAAVVKEYLQTVYPEKQAEVVLNGVTYKILKRESVTSFYDADGNTLFDVENSRLAKEYEFVMKETTDPKCQSAKQIDKTGEEDLKCSGGVDEKCEDCEKESEEEIEDSSDEDGESDETEEADAVPMGTASLSNIVIGNVSDPTPEEVKAAKEENAKLAKEHAKEKLQAELKAAKEKGFAEPIINYLLKRCDEDNGLAKDVAQKHKTWEKCFSYIYSKAKGQAKGNCVAVRDDVVYEWAEDYYHKDDKAEEEKKARKAAERAKQHKANEKKQKEEQKKRIERMEKRHEKNEPSKNAGKQKMETDPAKREEPKPKKNSKDMEGQMDLFSLMGM